MKKDIMEEISRRNDKLAARAGRYDNLYRSGRPPYREDYGRSSSYANYSNYGNYSNGYSNYSNYSDYSNHSTGPKEK